MKHLKKEEVEELLKSRPRRRGVVEFADQIAALKQGEGLQISLSEWKRKTPPTHYFATKFNKGGARVVSISKIGNDEFLVEKL